MSTGPSFAISKDQDHKLLNVLTQSLVSKQASFQDSLVVINIKNRCHYLGYFFFTDSFYLLVQFWFWTAKP